MRISVWPDQRRPWSEIAAIVDQAEATGWDGAYVYDHFMENDDDDRIVDGPVLEAWTTLTALAVRTSRLRLGPLVLGNLYRHPAVVARMAATLDQISNGRLVLGLGAGWQVNEHQSFGIELTAPGPRLDQFEEACQVIRSMLTKDRTDFAGSYYRITSAPIQPRPVQPRVPILIGAKGERRGIQLAAKYADEWNAWCTPEQFRHKSAVLDQHCADLGRDPATIARSTQAVIELTDAPTSNVVNDDDGPLLRGSTEQLATVMRDYESAGVDEFIVPDESEIPIRERLEQLERLRSEVFAPVR